MIASSVTSTIRARRDWVSLGGPWSGRQVDVSEEWDVLRFFGLAANVGKARRERSNRRLPAGICIRPHRKGIRPRPLAARMMLAITRMTSGAAFEFDHNPGLPKNGLRFRHDLGAGCGGPRREVLLPDRSSRDICAALSARNQSGLTLFPRRRRLGPKTIVLTVSRINR